MTVGWDSLSCSGEGWVPSCHHATGRGDELSSLSAAARRETRARRHATKRAHCGYCSRRLCSCAMARCSAQRRSLRQNARMHHV
eukprot:scaffold4542_cov71-Phaeocystis_antarctica.AAC.4